MVDAGERLQVLLTQEATIYHTMDYLTRMTAPVHHLEHNSNGIKALSSEQQQQAEPQSPSTPKKRKSWEHLTSVEEEDHHHQDQQSSSSDHDHSKHHHKQQHTENPCRRTCATSNSSCATDKAATGGCSTTTNTGTSGNNGSRSVGTSSSTGTSQINKHWREKICEWAYQVVDHFDLNREVVSVAMNHLDRYLSSFEGVVDKNLFQLLAMTCLYLSIKLNEYKHLLIPGSKSSMDTILQLSRGFFTLEEMERMEYEVLQRLQWFVHPPTSQIFMKHFLYFLQVEDSELHDLAQFMIELSVMDYFFVSYRPSEIAIAALLNSLNKLNMRANTMGFPFNYLNLQSPAVIACRERLSLIYAQANEQSEPDPSTTSTPNAKNEPPVPEPSTPQRTISPVSVMGTSDEQHKEQQLIESSFDSKEHVDMDTDDGGWLFLQ